MFNSFGSSKKRGETARSCSLALLSIVGAICFLIVTNFMQPGSLDMVTPTHSDFYRYFLLSQEPWLPENWLAPRPLMLAYLKIVGIFDQPKALYLSLAAPALLFLVLIPCVANRLELTKSSALSWSLFFFVAFGSPYFYSTYQYDFGGMLSGLFATLAVYSGVLVQKRSNEKGLRFFPLGLMLCLCSVESKPTYSIALLYLSLVGAVLFKNKRSLALFGGVLLILCFTFAKDRFLGSPFLASADEQSPYTVVIDPARNLQVLAFYVSHSFTPPLALAAAASLATLVVCRKWKLAIITLILGMTASAPMALLVNRRWETYAWYSTVITALLIMFAADRLLLLWRKSDKSRTRTAAAFMLVVLWISVLMHAMIRNPGVEWTLRNQAYNRNVLQVLETMEPAAGNGKILIAGLKGPYHAFKNTAYVQQQYPQRGQFDVLLNKSEKEWNRMSSREQTNGVYSDQVKMDAYSSIVVFNDEGRISEVKNSQKEGRSLLEKWLKNN